jgi:hypothetical protein
VGRNVTFADIMSQNKISFLMRKRRVSDDDGTTLASESTMSWRRGGGGGKEAGAGLINKETH